ncbi:MAG: pinensin family lanthipeptide [Bacteroidota bacterium]
MKNRKLNLDELQVESFVTSFDAYQDGTVKGGGYDVKQDTSIPTEDTAIFTSTGVSTPQLTPTRQSIMEVDTGGCQHTEVTKTINTTQIPTDAKHL